jgi:hypothetical protein
VKSSDSPFGGWGQVLRRGQAIRSYASQPHSSQRFGIPLLSFTRQPFSIETSVFLLSSYFFHNLHPAENVVNLYKITKMDYTQELAEIRALLREVVETQKESARQIKENGRQIGGIGEKFDSFTEGLAYPSMRKHLYQKYGIDNTVANYLRRLPNGEHLELDAFGFTNGVLNTAVVVEVKSHLQSKHIYEFVSELKKFRENFPDFKEKKLYGILATVRVVSKELRKEIFANGLHLAIIHDDIFDLQENQQAIDFNAA